MAASWWQIGLFCVAVLGFLGTLGIGVFKAGVWVQKTNTDVSNFKKLSNKISKDLKTILERLPATPYSNNSPVELNRLGQTISEQLHINTWAKSTSTQLAAELEGKESFEIHEFCTRYVEREISLLSTELRECAYEHGVTVEQIRVVYVIELRDALLRTVDSVDQPGIPPEV